MKIWLEISILTAALGIFPGCSSKVLNADRARSLVEDHLKKQSSSVFVGDLTSRIGVLLPEKASTIPGMRRLLDGGYLDEKTVKISYPDLTGSYEGSWPNAYVGNYPDVIRVRIGVNEQNRPPWVTLTYHLISRTYYPSEQEYGEGVCSGQQDTTFWITCRSSRGAMVEPAKMLLNPDQSNPGQISGQFLLSGTINGPAPLNLRGTSTRRTFGQDKYTYAWSRKFPASILVGNAVILDRVSVDTCDNLLLNGETNASCSLKWHSDLDAPRKSIFGRDRLEGVISASFGKQPDGNWLVTAANAPTAPYTVFGN